MKLSDLFILFVLSMIPGSIALEKLPSASKDVPAPEVPFLDLGKFFVYINCTNCKVRSELVVIESGGNIDTGTETEGPGTETKDPGTETKGNGTTQKGNLNDLLYRKKESNLRGNIDTGTETKGPGTETKGPGTENKGTGTETKGPGTMQKGNLKDLLYRKKGSYLIGGQDNIVGLPDEVLEYYMHEMEGNIDTGTETKGPGTETEGPGTETKGPGTETKGRRTETKGTETETKGPESSISIYPDLLYRKKGSNLIGNQDNIVGLPGTETKGPTTTQKGNLKDLLYRKKGSNLIGSEDNIVGLPDEVFEHYMYEMEGDYGTDFMKILPRRRRSSNRPPGLLPRMHRMRQKTDLQGN